MLKAQVMFSLEDFLTQKKKCRKQIHTSGIQMDVQIFNIDWYSELKLTEKEKTSNLNFSAMIKIYSKMRLLVKIM